VRILAQASVSVIDMTTAYDALIFSDSWSIGP